MLDRILCLANSYKHDHRCVAGISLDSKRWVRLVGRTIPGCLTLREASYPDGKELRLLDIFEAQLDEPCASNCHPEDTHFGPAPLRFVERYDPVLHADQLSLRSSKEQTVLQGASDRIYHKKLDNFRLARSIELIQPDDLWWWIREGAGKRRNRALFRMGHPNRIRYDLAVTDPVWLQQLNLLPPGVYPHSLLTGTEPCKTLLTASLSEAFEGFHYKLIAGVLVVPEPARISRKVAPANPSH